MKKIDDKLSKVNELIDQKQFYEAKSDNAKFEVQAENSVENYKDKVRTETVKGGFFRSLTKAKVAHKKRVEENNNKKIEKLTQQLDELNQRAKTVHDHLLAKELEIDEQQARINLMKTEFNTTQANLKNSDKELVTKKKVMNSLKNDEKEIELSLSRLRTEHEDLSKELGGVNKKLAVQKKYLSEQVAKSRDLSTKITSKKDQVNNFGEEVVKLKEKVSAVENEILLKRQEEESINRHVEGLIADIAEEEKVFSEVKSQYNDLVLAISGANKDKRDYVVELDNLKKLIKEFEFKIKEKMQEERLAEQSLKEIKATVENLELKKTNSELELKELSLRLQSAQKKTSDAENSLFSIQQKIEAGEAEKVAMENEVKNLQIKFQKTEKDLEEGHLYKRKITDETHMFEDRRDSLLNELEFLYGEKEGLDESVKALEKELNSIKSESGQAEQRVSKQRELNKTQLLEKESLEAFKKTFATQNNEETAKLIKLKEKLQELESFTQRIDSEISFLKESQKSTLEEKEIVEQKIIVVSKDESDLKKKRETLRFKNEVLIRNFEKAKNHFKAVENSVKNLESEVTEQDHRNHELTKRLEKLSSLSEEKLNQMTSKESKLQSVKDYEDSLMFKVNSHIQKINQLEIKLDEIQQSTKKYVSLTKKQELVLEKKQKEIQESEDKINNLHALRERKIDSLERVEADSKEAHLLKEKLTNEFIRAKEEFDSINEKFDNKKAELMRVSSLNSENEKRILTLREDKKSLENAMSQLDSDLNQKKTTLQEREKRVVLLEKNVELNKNKIDELVVQLSEKTNTSERLTSEMKSIEVTLRKVEGTRHNHSLELADKNKDVQAKELELNDKKEKYEQCNRQNRELLYALEAANTDIGHLDRQIKNYTCENATQERRLEHLTTQVEITLSEIEKKKEALASLQKKYATQEQQIREKKKELGETQIQHRLTRLQE